MPKTLYVKKIEKLNENKIKVYNNIKIISLYGLLFFATTRNGLETEAEQIIAGGSVLFGTIDLISTVKSLCKIYQLKEEKKELENENRQK